MRILLTGAVGRIGTVLTTDLSRDHALRGVDLRAAPDFPGEFIVGDCGDPAVAATAVEGMDAVVHLAGFPTEAPLATAIDSHIVSTTALLDAMVQCGVRRMVYASSNHAVGMTPRTDLLTVDTRTRPDTFYGVGKVAAEAVLSLYADRYGIEPVALRIGSFKPRPRSIRDLSTWLSHADCGRLVRAALTGPVLGFTAVYGISANSAGWWDLAPGRALGYHPEDDADQYRSTVPETPEDADEGRLVGGDFTLPGFDRRPFEP